RPRPAEEVPAALRDRRPSPLTVPSALLLQRRSAMRKLVLPALALAVVSLAARGYADWLSPARQGPTARVAAVAASSDAKAEVAAQVNAGKLSLLQAANRFGKIDASTPELAGALQQVFPGCGPEERRCREVILFARGHLSAEYPEGGGEAL